MSELKLGFDAFVLCATEADRKYLKMELPSTRYFFFEDELRAKDESRKMLGTECVKACVLSEAKFDLVIQMSDSLDKIVKMAMLSGFKPMQDSLNPIHAWLYDAMELLAKARGEI
jgi:hypothetical protein